MKADDFLSQYQMMEQYGVASAEEVKVENLADHTQNRDHSCRNGVRDAMLRPKLLLLDEPSFGLAPLGVQEIFRILRTINRNGGVSMLLVEQNANIPLELADYAYLIETGGIVMGGPAAIIACDHAVRRAYLGY